MDVTYWESQDHAEVHLEKGDFEIEARRHGEHITFRVRNRCNGTFVGTETIFNCDEWDEALCQLSRVDCGPRDCECDEDETEIVFIPVRVFDQDDYDYDDDDCDERPAPKTRPQPKNRKS